MNYCPKCQCSTCAKKRSCGECLTCESCDTVGCKSYEAGESK